MSVIERLRRLMWGVFLGLLALGIIPGSFYFWWRGELPSHGMQQAVGASLLAIGLWVVVAGWDRLAARARGARRDG